MFIKDVDCTKDTPLVLGYADQPIYGKDIRIRPRIDGRKDSAHFRRNHLPELLPLEEYDLIVVLLSGGKDSVACFYKLLELGVPKKKLNSGTMILTAGIPQDIWTGGVRRIMLRRWQKRKI